MIDFTRRLGLAALASLPLWAALAGVLFLARDLSEIAAAGIAAAMAITLAGVVAIASVTRRTVKASNEHEIVVRQSLALVDCMRQINHRVAQIEARAGVAPAAPLAVATDMAPPPARNDIGTGTATGPEAVVVQPMTSVSHASGTRTDSAGETAAELPPVSRWDERPRRLPTAATPSDVTERSICRLETGAVCGLRLSLNAASPSAIAAMASRAVIAVLSNDCPVEIVLPQAGTTRRDLCDLLRQRLGSAPALAARMYVGTNAEGLGSGGGEGLRDIAGLIRCGARLSLHGLTDLSHRPPALASAGVARIVFDGARLCALLAADPDHGLNWVRALARDKIELVASDIGQEGLARVLAAFEIGLGFGPALAAAPPAAIRTRMPWRSVLGRKTG